MRDRYELTIKFAPMDTPLFEGGRSSTGHIWYEVKDTYTNKVSSYGWSTGNSVLVGGENNIVHNDNVNYIEDRWHKISSITTNITDEQAAALHEFPDLAAAGKIDGFSTSYDIFSNSCVDFVGQALAHAGLADSNYQGNGIAVFPNTNPSQASFLYEIMQHRDANQWVSINTHNIVLNKLLEKYIAEGKNLIKNPDGTFYVPAASDIDLNSYEYNDEVFDNLNEQAYPDGWCPVPPPLPRDPLSLDLNGDGEVSTISKDRGVYFDLDNSGFAERTAWIAPEDGLLVLDHNGNGQIDGGAELFGTETLLADGSFAANGFEALKEFDENGDGVIDANDAVFADLRVWQDGNSDGLAQDGELKTLAELGITAIGTDYRSDGVFTDQQGVEHREFGEFVRAGAGGAVHTLWFDSDTVQSVPVDVHQGAAIVALPQARKAA